MHVFTTNLKHVNMQTYMAVGSVTTRMNNS